MLLVVLQFAKVNPHKSQSKLCLEKSRFCFRFFKLSTLRNEIIADLSSSFKIPKWTEFNFVIRPLEEKFTEFILVIDYL